MVARCRLADAEILAGGEVEMRTRGEIEAAVCEGISSFEREYTGRGSKDTRADLLSDLLVVRLRGDLTAAEGHLVKTPPAERGRDLLKASLHRTVAQRNTSWPSRLCFAILPRDSARRRMGEG